MNVKALDATLFTTLIGTDLVLVEDMINSIFFWYVYNFIDKTPLLKISFPFMFPLIITPKIQLTILEIFTVDIFFCVSSSKCSIGKLVMIQPQYSTTVTSFQFSSPSILIQCQNPWFSTLLLLLPDSLPWLLQ